MTAALTIQETNTGEWTWMLLLEKGVRIHRPMMQHKTAYMALLAAHGVAKKLSLPIGATKTYDVTGLSIPEPTRPRQ